MQIRLNGDAYDLGVPDEGDATLDALLVRLGLQGRRLAVEVNGELVPRGAQSGFPLNPGDCVEIVQAIGGG